jgi:hypothetical protein
MCVTSTFPKFYFLPTVMRTCTKLTTAHSFKTQLLKKCPAFSTTARLIATFTGTRHLYLPPSHPIHEWHIKPFHTVVMLRSICIFSFHLLGDSASQEISRHLWYCKINCHEWPYPQEHATGSSPEPHESISQCIAVKIHLNIVFSSTPMSSKRSLSFRLRKKLGEQFNLGIS